MNKQKQAFTLVELIVVITILAILGTIAFISLQGYSKDARDSIRISDISSIKTSLELFHLNSGKYPLPDNNQIVDYGTEILWYQGDFGSSVISSLSRSMSEIPTDPLTDKKYVFSVANNKNEFEILSLLEGDSLALNPLIPLSGEIATAASLEVTPKIDGTYNRVFIKTANYIVPVPSIINTEVGTVTMTLDSSNISSQVINGGENIPEQGNVVSNTGALTGLVLSVYTGSIAIDDDNSEKEIVIEKIKDAYTGSVLASSDIYEYIFSASGELENVTLVNSLVLKDDITEVTVIPDPYETCISGNNPSVFPATTTYGNCDIPDFIVCRGLQIGFTIAGCNVGTDVSATAFNDTNGYGELFQWGNNTGIKSASTSGTQISVTSTGSTHSHPDFITNASDWNSTTNDNLWGDTPGTPLDRKGPCDAGYHIPSGDDWLSLHTALGFSGDGLAYSNAIKLPMAGQRAGSDGAYRNEGYYGHNRGFYWSSSPTGLQSFHFVHYSGYVQPKTNMGRSTGLSVRCFKN